MRERSGLSRVSEYEAVADEGLLAKVFEQSPMAMALVGPDFRLRRVNGAFCSLLGYTADELEHLTFIDITHASSAPSARIRSRSGTTPRATPSYPSS